MKLDLQRWKFFHVEELLSHTIPLRTPLTQILMEVVFRSVSTGHLLNLLGSILAERKLIETIRPQGLVCYLYRSMQVPLNWWRLLPLFRLTVDSGIVREVGLSIGLSTGSQVDIPASNFAEKFPFLR